MRQSVKFLSVTISMIMLLSIVGISQVTHICKMAVAGIELQGCKDESTGQHPCCKSETGSQQKSSEEECCKDIVKYYQQKVNTILQAPIKMLEQHFFICFHNNVASEIIIDTPFSYTGNFLLHIEKPLKTRLACFQIFLI